MLLLFDGIEKRGRCEKEKGRRERYEISSSPLLLFSSTSLSSYPHFLRRFGLGLEIIGVYIFYETQFFEKL